MSTNIRSEKIGDIYYQNGNGVPTHIAIIGTVYIDVNTGLFYTNRNGIALWSEPSGGGGIPDAPIDNVTYGRENGSWVDLNSKYLSISGGTVVGLSATTISATTYQNLPEATPSVRGVVNIGTQSFGGNKTFFGLGTLSEIIFEIFNQSNVSMFEITNNPNIGLRLNAMNVVLRQTGTDGEVRTINGGSRLIIGGNTSTTITQGNPNNGTIRIGQSTNNSAISTNRKLITTEHNITTFSGMSNWQLTLFALDNILDFTDYGGGGFVKGIHINPQLTNLPDFQAIHAAVGSTHLNITTPDSKAIFEVGGTLKVSKPYPRLTQAQRLALTGILAGSFVYQTDNLIGVWEFNGVRWIPPRREVKDVTGTTYTLLEEDDDKILHFTNNSDVTITIPTGLTPTNRYEGKQLGDGQLIFGTDVGVDLRVGTSEVAKTAEKYSVFGLDVIGTEEYMLFGKLELS